ncbi:MAG TPA: 50S ribosomal protein L3 [bacterium]|nr:50S ribosomal protein L3 [bacterium]
MKNFTMGLLGKKLGMTQIFTDDGKAVQVTVVQAGPCTVVQIKNGAGSYQALQLGFDEGKAKSFTKPLQGHFAKAGTPPFKFLREVRLSGDEAKNYAAGQVLGASVFQEGEFVDVCGVSKGKGYAGVIKRHHFGGSPASHGTHEYFRHSGSIGQHSFPGRVFKGLKMAGQLGNARATVQNLKVVKVLEDKNLLLIGGAVPGANGGYIVIRKAVKKKPKAAAKK